MGQAERDFNDKFTRDMIKGMMTSGYKTIYIRDAAGRIETVYEAPLNVEAGEVCLRTVLKYEDGAGGTSKRVIAQEESLVGWPGYTAIGGTDDEDITTVP